MQAFTLSLTQRGYEWHREDAALSDLERGIFAVADGITLPIARYPDIGARVAAETFCREAIATLKRSGKTTQEAITLAYQQANQAVAAYNRERGYDYAATVALALVAGSKLWLTRVSDCGLMLLRDGGVLYQTQEFWEYDRLNGSPRWNGVVNGVDDLANFIDFHQSDYQPGDYLLLYTDGFEPHSVESNFHRLFGTKSDWDKLPEMIKTLDQELVERDEKRFGKERTLTVVKLAN